MEENSIRFEDIPNAITGVLKKLSSLEDKIDGIYELVQSEKEETWFTVAELCAYLPTHPVEHTCNIAVSINYAPDSCRIICNIRYNTHKTIATYNIHINKYAVPASDRKSVV